MISLADLRECWDFASSPQDQDRTLTIKALFPYRQDPTFWRALTRKTFRIPPQPLLQADGARWQWLYKYLLTRTQLFTWGSDANGNLGPRNPALANGKHPEKNSWPRRVIVDDDVGVVADVQCGGWSTYILNSIGVIYMFGIFNGMVDNGYSPLKRMLIFPSAYPTTTASRYEPSTAIQQCSAGRSHIIGLADNGNVWLWTNDMAVAVQPLGIDISGGRVKRVVAGWDRSSIYVNSVGILYWPPGKGYLNQDDLSSNIQLIEPVVIPGTGYRRKRNDRILDTLDSRIGQVINYIVLEGYVVFTTDLDKIFSYKTPYPLSEQALPEPVELTTFYPESSQSSFGIRDLQGSFRSFALFTKSGAVLTASCPLLDIFHSQPNTGPLPHPTIIPGLQGHSVISLAFGDHHFHALHANGTISSYGTEPQGCGALGLGQYGTAILRGVQAGWGFSRMNWLPNGKGCTVWFEPLKNLWLRDMYRKSNEGEAAERGTLLNVGHGEAREAVASYFEREGNKWEDGVTAAGEIGAYFALKVSAAGWHSAALVLVDEEKAAMAERKHMINSQLPAAASSLQKPDDTPERQPPEPREVASWLAWFSVLLVHALRSFLGLTARDTAAAANTRDQSSRIERVPVVERIRRNRILEGVDDADEEEEENGVYSWSKDPFPRLRMANGEVMPGEIEVMD